jgi:hypothetical protein
LRALCPSTETRKGPRLGLRSNLANDVQSRFAPSRGQYTSPDSARVTRHPETIRMDV